MDTRFFILSLKNLTGDRFPGRVLLNRQYIMSGSEIETVRSVPDGFVVADIGLEFLTIRPKCNGRMKQMPPKIALDLK